LGEVSIEGRGGGQKNTKRFLGAAVDAERARPAMPVGRPGSPFRGLQGGMKVPWVGANER